MRQPMEVPRQEQGLSPEEERWNNEMYRTFSECNPRRRESEGEKENESIRKSNDLWELDFKLRRLRAGLGARDEFDQKEKVFGALKELTRGLGLDKVSFEDLIRAQDRGLIAQASEDLFWEEEYKKEEESREAA